MRKPFSRGPCVLGRIRYWCGCRFLQSNTCPCWTLYGRSYQVRRVVTLTSCMNSSPKIVPSMLTTTYHPLLKISSLHLIEPFLLGVNIQNLFSPLSDMTNRRRDIWRSSKEAIQSLKVRPTMSTWDERILKIFVVSFTSLFPLSCMTNLILNRNMVFDRYPLQNTRA